MDYNEDDDDDDDAAPRSSSSSSKRGSKKGIKAATASSPSSSDDEENESEEGEEGKKRTGGRAPRAKKAAGPPKSFFDATKQGSSDDQDTVRKFVSSALTRWASAADGSDTTISARRELFNFVFRSAGAAADVFSPDENVDALLIEDLTALGLNMVLAPGISSDFNYPLLKVNPPKAFKNVRKGFLSVWNLIMTEGDDEVLFGTTAENSQSLLDSLIDFLTTLSEHKIRSLRHAATLGGLHLMLALYSKYDAYAQQTSTQLLMIESDSKSLAQMVRNAETHGNKSVGGIDPKSRASAILSLRNKLAGMKDAAQLTEASAENCKTCAEALFQGIFAHRYRDAAVAIRVDVLDVLESLLLKYPSQFLNNSHLKYPGWLLSDQAAPVRKRSLDLLSNLMTLPHELINQTHEFVNRFRTRLIELGRDIDDGVAASAVRFLRLTVSSGGAALITGSEDLHTVQEGLLSASSAVRSQVGLILCEQLEAFKTGPGEAAAGGGSATMMTSSASSSSAGAGNAKKKKSQLETIVTIGIRLAPQEEEEEDNASQSLTLSSLTPSHSGSEVMTYIASAFWPHAAASVLTDWDAFRSYLLGRGGGGSSSAAAAKKTKKGKKGGRSSTGRKGGGGGGDEDGEEEEENDDEDEEERGGGRASLETSDLSDKQALFCIRLLHCCIWRSVGEGFQTDGRVGVPAAANESVPHLRDGYLTSPTDEKAIIRSKSSMSSGVCLLLPELMARYGDIPECSILLSSAVTALSIETFAISRHSKSLSSLLYQLQRQLMLHVSPTALTSISSALLFLARESHSKNREALKDVQRLVAKLASDAVRLSKGMMGKDDKDRGATTKDANDGGRRTSKRGSAAALSKTKAKTKGSKGEVKKKKKSSSANMNDEEEEEEEEDEEDDDDDENDEGGLASPTMISSATISGLAVTLRRLRILSNVSVELDLPIAEFEAGSPFLTTVKRILTNRTSVSNQKELFKVAKNAESSSSLVGQAAALESISPALVREALLLLCSSAEFAIVRAIKATAELIGVSSEEEVSAVVDKLVPDALSARDDAIATCMSLLLTAHHLGRPGTGPASKEALEIPPSSAPFERAYILRIRYSAFSSICHLGVLCSSQQMSKNDHLKPLSYVPSDGDEAALMAFANRALDMTARDLSLMGIAIKHPYLRSKEEAAVAAEESSAVSSNGRAIDDEDDEEEGENNKKFTNDDLDELEMREEDTQMTQAASQLAEEEEETAASAGGGAAAAAAAAVAIKKRSSSASSRMMAGSGLTSLQSVTAKETAKVRMLLLRDESVKVAKAMLIVKPLAELSLSTPTAERLGHTVSRRVLDDDVEVGAFGLPIVSHMMAKIRETSPASLMAMQLRSALDAAAGLQRMRSRLPEDDDDSQADFWLQLSGMVDVVIKLVHRQSQIASGHAQHKLAGVGGKAPKELVEAIITMLSDGTVKALTSAPDRCTVFGLLAIYIPLLDAKATANVRAMFEKHAWGGSTSAGAGDDDAATASSTTHFSPQQRKIFKASLSCYRTRVKRGMSCDPDAEFEGVTFSDLQAWIPAACFYDLLCEKVNPGSKSIEHHVKRALRACLGMQTEMAMAGGDSATPGKKKHAASSSTTKKSAGGKKKASKRRRSKDDDEEDEEDDEDENEEGRDEDEHDGQDAPAANEEEEEEANDDDDNEEEGDADDDEDVGFAKKRGKPKSKRGGASKSGGGQTKKKTNVAATAAAASKKKQAVFAGGRKPSLSSSSSASSSASTTNPSSSQSTFLSALITGGSSTSTGGRQASSSSSSNAKGSGAGGGAPPQRRSVTRPHPGTIAATATKGGGANTGEYNRFTQDTGISLTQRPNIDDDDE